MESADATGPSEIVARLLAFHDAEICPVLPVGEIAERLGDGMARRRVAAGPEPAGQGSVEPAR